MIQRYDLPGITRDLPGSADNLAGGVAGEGPVLDHDLAVHDDVLYP